MLCVFKTFACEDEANKLQTLVEQIGQDGWNVLNWIGEADAPEWLREIPAVEILRQVWLQQFWIEENRIRFRSNDDIPPASLLISSPYDTQAHLSIKRETVWTGYKVHLTETCDDDVPHLVVHVETTPAPTQDVGLTDTIHEELERKHLLPCENLVDAGYIDGEHIVTSLKHYGVELIGPVASKRSWQAKAAQGFDHTQFQIDWERKIVTCPQGNTSRKWTVKQDKATASVIRAQFSKKECLACPVRSQCTRAPVNPRQIVFCSRAQYEAIHATRKLQTTP